MGRSSLFLALVDWRDVALVVVLWCPALSSVSVTTNHSQMRTTKCTCLIFGVSIVLHKRNFWLVKVTRVISPIISWWLLVISAKWRKWTGRYTVLLAFPSLHPSVVPSVRPAVRTQNLLAKLTRLEVRTRDLCVSSQRDDHYTTVTTG